MTAGQLLRKEQNQLETRYKREVDKQLGEGGRSVIPFHSSKNAKQITAVPEELISCCPFVSPIEEDDRDLFRKFFAAAVARLPVGEGYGYSWAYITQMAHGRAYGYPLGLKYYDERVLVPIGYFPRPASNGHTWHFHLVRPMGNWKGERFFELCELLLKLSQAPVYVRKLSDEEETDLLNQGSFHLAEQHPWHREAFMEDDTEAEIIIDVNHTLSYLVRSGDNELKRKYRHFLRQFPGVEWRRYDPADQLSRSDAEAVVRQFMDYPQVKAIGISTYNDFANMIYHTPPGKNGKDFFSALLYVEGQVAGLYVAERLGQSQTAGVYANISLREDFRYVSEYLLLELLYDLQNAGITAVNLGGSETRGLHNFKTKFRRSRGALKRMRWAVFTGDKLP